jgi:hypothetical protein
MININTLIYGKVYFPVRSNSLKAIGTFIGASWTSPDASGLQSLVWRYHWDKTQDAKYRDLLLTYNEEDCRALQLLTHELLKIQDHSNSLHNVDFANSPKQHVTEVGNQLHDEFDMILKFAHDDYDKRKITLRQSKEKNEEKKNRGAQKGHQVYRRKVPKANKIIREPRRRKCPKHHEKLRSSNEMAERTIRDLIFTKSGVRKTVTKYTGKKAYCKKCQHHYSPWGIQKLSNRMFGHGFQSWVIYQRLALHVPYRTIIDSLQDQFNERISIGTTINFLRYFSEFYSYTDQILLKRILQSPFVHVDETKISIQGYEHLVWVFTDGRHVVFKLTESREASIVHELLSDYQGILISDFYSGYDAIPCRQQKCWAHLIGDLNDDLWKAPFDSEFETFVQAVRDLILPILEVVERCGLKKRAFSKFRKNVDRFYKEFVEDIDYRSELTIKYQKRFLRYRESLFTFLEHDGIPWNNNMAERALRYLAVQRKISGSFFESIAHHYLLLLGIMQTCRFQGKSLLKYFLSKEKDIDNFKKSRPIKHSKPAIKI